MNKPKTKIYVILVNYNGHEDTVECLESLFNIDRADFSVIVVDNSQSERSLNYIKSWADGAILFNKRKQCPVTIDTVKKPVKYTFVNDNAKREDDERLIIIRSAKNEGFAAANNLAIKYLNNDYDWVWLLNNDTVVDKNWPVMFFQYINDGFDHQEGILGTDLYYYDRPNTLQGIGGIFNKWLATSKHLNVVPEDCVERRLKFDRNVDYVIGASMFVSQRFINDVGLMNESYFLYFEEMDWTIRGKALNYKLGYICNCKVYHKEGASIGSSHTAKKTEVADFYSLRNRLVFTRKFYPGLLPTVYLSLFISAFIRLYRRQFKRVRMIINMIFGVETSTPIMK